MRQQKIVIIGGSGFLGQTVVQKIAQTGATIHTISRNINSHNNLRSMGEVGQITPMIGDIQNFSQILSMTQGADVIVNLVGIMLSKKNQSFEAIHVKGAENVAHAAQQNNVKRLVHISAIGANVHSKSKYAQTKGQGEQKVQHIFPQATILRPSLVFGAQDHFFNMFAQMACLSPFLPLIGGGYTLFQPVYVGDVAKSVVNCIKNDQSMGQTYELGGPQVLSFKALIQMMLTQINRNRVLLPIPFRLATFIAKIMSILPNPPLTSDQIILLQSDTIVGPETLGLKDLQIEAQALEQILPKYLNRFQRHQS